MTESYLKIEIFSGDTETSDILVARLQETFDVEGFELTEDILIMYIDKNNFDEKLFKKILSINDIKYEISIIYTKNWNAEWESSFKPVVVDEFVAIRAGFHPKQTGVKYDIIITPKMSFGTGHHATTYMMLESLRQFNPGRKSVIDFGTGTGVLGILAEKMGASKILAIDNDDWSIENATENIRTNNSSVIQLQKTDQFPVSGTWDIILANINLNVILCNFGNFSNSMHMDSILIISGILNEDYKNIINAAHLMSLKPEIKMEKNNWLCIAFRKMDVL